MTKKKSGVMFFRPGVDLSKIKRDAETGYLNETVTVEGTEYFVFGNGKWTGLKPVPKPTKVRAK